MKVHRVLYAYRIIHTPGRHIPTLGHILSYRRFVHTFQVLQKKMFEDSEAFGNFRLTEIVLY